jgi:predicted nucleotidyltransferase
MKFGLTESEYQYIRESVVDRLDKLGAKVWCFGSRATGKFSKFSDLDLLIEHPDDISTQVAEIEELLINSNFALKVDLVLSKNLAASYAADVNSEKILF